MDRTAAFDDPSSAPACCPKRGFIVFRCADNLNGDDYYESIDLIDAFHPQTIVAHSLNGEPLPERQRRAAADARRAAARL